jgi:hypothetical protein
LVSSLVALVLTIPLLRLRDSVTSDFLLRRGGEEAEELREDVSNLWAGKLFFGGDFSVADESVFSVAVANLTSFLSRFISELEALSMAFIRPRISRLVEWEFGFLWSVEVIVIVRWEVSDDDPELDPEPAAVIDPAPVENRVVVDDDCSTFFFMEEGTRSRDDFPTILQSAEVSDDDREGGDFGFIFLRWRSESSEGGDILFIIG